MTTASSLSLYPFLPPGPTHYCHQSDPLLTIRQNNTRAWHSKPIYLTPISRPATPLTPGSLTPNMGTYLMREPPTRSHFATLRNPSHAPKLSPDALQRLPLPGARSTSPSSCHTAISLSSPWSVVPGAKWGSYFWSPSAYPAPGAQ